MTDPEHAVGVLWDVNICGHTTIFWDLVDSSILDGRDPYSVFDHIKPALEGRGYHGQVSVEAYVDENTFPKDFTARYGRARIHINFVPQGDKYSRVHRMLNHLLIYALNHADSPSTLIVLSKDIQVNPLFSSFQEKASSQKQRKYNVIVASLESLIGEGVPIGQKRIQQRNEILIVISGISEFDRGIVFKKLGRVRKDLHFPVTVTSSCEMTTPGEDSLLVQEDEFMKMVEKDELLLYNKDKGVTKNEIHDFMGKGKDIVLGVDDIVDLRNVLGNSAIYVLLVSESKLSMEASSEAVKTEKELVRLAAKEYNQHDFDYIVVYGDENLDGTVNRLKSIITAEKCKVCPRIVKI